MLGVQILFAIARDWKLNIGKQGRGKMSDETQHFMYWENGI
jgi:hypothetical protein